MKRELKHSFACLLGNILNNCKAYPDEKGIETQLLVRGQLSRA